MRSAVGITVAVAAWAIIWGLTDIPFLSWRGVALIAAVVAVEIGNRIAYA